MKTNKKNIPFIDGPLLDLITINFNDEVNFNEYPFSVPIIKNLKQIEFPTEVTFLVGENGSGKSTILEALANKAGFGAEGGSKNINFQTSDKRTYVGAEKLGEQMSWSWRFHPKNGYFFRAESFFNVANFIDQLGGNAHGSYGGKSLHDQSHGESFFSFFNNRLGNSGFFIFDEPEAALSPNRQLSLLAIINDMCKKKNFHAQFLIATHSPLLLAYPNATIYSCNGNTLEKIEYKETEHYQTTKHFLDNPDLFLHHLFKN